jgi:hypothetical protein
MRGAMKIKGFIPQLFLLFTPLFQVPLLAAQAALPGGKVEGNVVNAITGVPVAGAHVHMWPVPSSGETPPATAITDAAGHFVFPYSPPQYMIDVRKPGYLSARTPADAWYGPSGTPRFAITPEAVISGRLTSEDGSPVSGAFLVVNRYKYANGEYQMIEGGLSGETNERGEFRIGNLPAGRYSLCVRGMGSLRNDSRYAEQFYPGTVEPSASGEIEVKTGEELSGIEFRLSTHPGAIISGRIEGPASPEATVLLLTHKRQEIRPSRECVVGADGSFAISRVPPGTYIVQVRTGSYPPTPGDLFVEREIQIAAHDVRNLILETRTVEPMHVSGTVTLEDGSTRPLVVAIVRRGEDEVGGRLSGEDGSFVVDGLVPGHYYVTVLPDPRFPDASARSADRPFSRRHRPAEEWMPILVSATWDGKDVLEEGFFFDGTEPGPLRLIVRLP